MAYTSHLVSSHAPVKALSFRASMAVAAPSVMIRPQAVPAPVRSRALPHVCASATGGSTSYSGAGRTGSLDFGSPAPLGPVAKFMTFFIKDGKLNKDKLASAGASLTLSYGFVSNVNAFTLLMVAWFSFFKTTGLSPLAPGQWPKYLAVYAALYATIGNLLRPLRIAAAAAIAPVFEKLVSFFQRKFGLTRPWAFGATVFIVNVCGTLSYFGLGVLVLNTAMSLFIK